MAERRRKRPDHHVGVKKIIVMHAKDKRSRSGNDMIVMKLSIDERMDHLITEYLVFTERASWKIKKFFAALGKEITDGQEIKAKDIYRCVGYAEVGVRIDEYKPRDKTYYIVKWLPRETAETGVDQSVTVNGATATSPTDHE